MVAIRLAIRSVALKSRWGSHLYSGARAVWRRGLRWIPDRPYARVKYFRATGRCLRLRTPQLLTEKLWWLKLHNRDPRLTRLSDKLAVREYVKERGYGVSLIPIVGVYQSVNEIDFESLPQRAFIKTSHTSGVNAAWDASNPLDARKFKLEFSKAMKENYYWKSREWNYKDVTPNIIVEEHLGDENLVDYRFLCFHGRVRLIFVDIETANPDGTHFANARRNVHDRQFNVLPVKVKRESYDPTLVKRPPVLDQMIEMAEALAADLPFVRVDLYWTGGAIRFGEMTFYPGGGSQIAEPIDFEHEWGSWLDLAAPSIILGSQT